MLQEWYPRHDKLFQEGGVFSLPSHTWTSHASLHSVWQRDPMAMHHDHVLAAPQGIAADP